MNQEEKCVISDSNSFLPTPYGRCTGLWVLTGAGGSDAAAVVTGGDVTAGVGRGGNVKGNEVAIGATVSAGVTIKGKLGRGC